MLVKNTSLSIPRQDFGGNKRLRDSVEDHALSKISEEFEKKSGVIIGWRLADWTEQEMVLDVRSENGFAPDVLQEIEDTVHTYMDEHHKDLQNFKGELVLNYHCYEP